MAWKKDNKREAFTGLSLSPDVQRRRHSDERHDELALEPVTEISNSSGIVEAPPWFQSFESRVSARFSHLSSTLDEVKNLAQDAKREAQSAAKAANALQERIQEIEGDIENMKVGLWTKEELEDLMMKMMATATKETKRVSEGNENKNLQIIVGGFPEAAPASLASKNLLTGFRQPPPQSVHKRAQSELLKRRGCEAPTSLQVDHSAGSGATVPKWKPSREAKPLSHGCRPRSAEMGLPAVSALPLDEGQVPSSPTAPALTDFRRSSLMRRRGSA